MLYIHILYVNLYLIYHNYTGTEPKVRIMGPWSEQLLAAETKLLNNTDKKQIKDLESKVKELKDIYNIIYERILINKYNIQTFTIYNDSLLPIQYEIILLDFDNTNNNIVFNKMSGIIQPYITETISITLYSNIPMNIQSMFSIRYSDIEPGGLHPITSPITTPDQIVPNTTTKKGQIPDPVILDRSITQKFRIIGEIYTIQAVTFVGTNTTNITTNSTTTASSEIDFGLLKVGETVIQTVQISNLGKYDVNYKFDWSSSGSNKSGLAKYLSFDPAEGVLVAGTGKAPVSVKVSYCCPDKEMTVQVSG